MRDLFETLVADGEPAIQRLVAERCQEAVDLDFKTKVDATKPILNDEDRRVLGRTLSAFSNSMGGLIVYGIDARKNDEQVDCATELRPVLNIERFKNEVIRAAGQLLMPRHDGISVEQIPAAVPPGSGYLVIYVERSERRPHRSEAKGDKQYYKRSGESSFAMEHFDIEDMFKRNTTAVVDVTWHLEKMGGTSHADGSGTVNVAVVLSLKNLSNVSARYPYLHLVRGNFGTAGFPPMMTYGLLNSADEGWFYFDGGADHVIHPDMSRRVVKLTFSFPRTQHSNPHVPNLAEINELKAEYRCGCEHSQMRRGEVIVLPSDIQRLYS